MKRYVRAAVIQVSGFLSLVWLQSPAAASCDTLLPAGSQAALSVSEVSAESLIQLRDIGDPYPFYQSATLTLSPDKRSISFPLRQADIARNAYCTGIVVMELDPGSHPRLLDYSTALVMQNFDFRGPFVPADNPAPIIARWSPDGRWLAYLKAAGGETALWRASVDGSGAVKVSGPQPDLEDFQWSANGGALIANKPVGLEAARAAISDEGRRGYHYDRRFLPLSSDKPYPLAPATNAVVAFDVTNGRERAATGPERHAFEEGVGAETGPNAKGPGLSRAWTAPLHPDRTGSPNILMISDKPGISRRCPSALCTDVEGVWWSSDGADVAYVRREGWAGSQDAIYLWRVASDPPKRIFITDAVLSGCVRSALTLVCAEEAALQPRKIVGYDLGTGARSILFDPNPQFSSRYAGGVERLHWTNRYGRRAFGDLVYPANFHADRRYPLVITAYRSRGFLRGGTGDEYPIPLFAQRGYLVLNVDRPLDIGQNTRGVRDFISQQRVETSHWIDRRSVNDSMMHALRIVEKRRIVDSWAIGLTGLSDGASSASFALNNSNRFAAASISTCCIEPEEFLAFGGPANADFFLSTGYPGLRSRDVAFWRPMSMAANSRSIKTPLLMQLGDQEYRQSLITFEALRENGSPPDIYVFPGEGHGKLQPVHRLAIYNRNLAWFDFWLKHQSDTDLVPGDELERWKRMKAVARPARRVMPGRHQFGRTRDSQ